MDSNLIYVKTQVGDEAVRQSTRVVQRNLRLVLVQVDGNLSVGELSAKIGNPRLVERALRDLEEGGFIAPRIGAVLARQEAAEAPPVSASEEPALSQFSTFGERESLQSVPAPQPPRQPQAQALPQQNANSQFSSFGKPILPAAGSRSRVAPVEETKFERKPVIKKKPREDYRPIPWGRWLVRVPFILLLLSILLFFVYPYNNFKPAIEANASRLLQLPVSVGNVGVSAWPRPALVLSHLVLGGVADASIERVEVASPFSLWAGDAHRLPAIRVVGSSVPVDLLITSGLFKKAEPGTHGAVLSRLDFDRLSVLARDMAVRDLSGELIFKDDGALDKLALKNDEAGLRLQGVPAAEGLLLEIQGAGWKPFGKTLGFDSLQAKGLLQKGKLVIQSVDTTFLNGILKGSWLLDWSKENLSMAGDASLARLDCRKVTAAFVPLLNLEGELNGTLRLRASGKDWDSMWEGVDARLDAEIAHGILHGTDIGDAVRGGSGYIVRSGSTKFDRLRTALSIDAKQVVGRNLQMSAGMVNASGQFVANRGRSLEANLQVTMQTSVTTVRSPVRVTGELPNLVAVSGK